jgi:uncharacterized protein
MNLVRIVADTNVVVSAFLWGGKPRQLIDLGVDQQIRLITSGPLLAELRDVLAREKFRLRLTQIGVTVEALVSTYQRFCELAPDTEISPTVRDDQDDDVVLACALGGLADLIITRDAHLLNLKSYQHIAILTVDAFFLSFPTNPDEHTHLSRL